MFSNNSSPDQIIQATVALAANLSEAEYTNDDLRKAAYDEGLAIVKSAPGVELRGQMPYIGMACVWGTLPTLETLRNKLEESGRTLGLDDGSDGEIIPAAGRDGLV